MRNRVLTAVTTMALCALSSMAWAQGGVFVTGHDPDFHAAEGGVDALGAQHIIQDALAFVTDRPSNNVGNILLVTDTHDPGGIYSDSRLGMTAAGYSFTVADDGTAGGSVLNLSTVNFADYSAVVVASDYGGWLRQSELDILDARSNDIINYVNGGGGLVAFAESGPTSPGLTTHGEFGFLPFLASSAGLDQSEAGDSVTPFGASLGLTDFDVDSNFSHSIFLNTGGMNIVDRDGSGHIVSLAFRGTIGSGGAGVPEPGTLALLAGLSVSGCSLAARRLRRR